MLKRSLRRSVMAEVKARIARRVNQPPQEIGDREYDPDPAHRIRFGSTLPPISLLRFLCIVFPSRFRDVDTDRLMEAFQRFLFRHFPSLRQPGIIRPQVHHLPHLSTYTVSSHPESLQYAHSASRFKRLEQPTFHMSQLSTPACKQIKSVVRTHGGSPDRAMTTFLSPQRRTSCPMPR